MNETDFIAALRKLPLHPGARGLEDDCAVVEFASETLVVTHDSMAENTHFRADADMADVAWKLVAANLSDLAAKGGEPLGVLLSYSLGSDDDRFLKGLHDVLEAYDTALLGGDTIAAKGARTFGLTAIGRATHTPVPSRAGARPGDAIYVTGTLGRAMLGFEGQAKHLEAYNRPKPLIDEGQVLAPHVSAMMDVSDGLLLDCWRMATASDVTLQLDSAAIPVADPTRLDDCIRWGDDYELLFIAPVGLQLPVPATQIGEVVAEDIAPLWLDAEILTPPQGLGYSHG